MTVTADQIVDAARELGQDEFTRADIAAKLGVEKPDLKEGFQEAKRSGRIQKIRNDEDNTGYFRLS